MTPKNVKFFDYCALNIRETNYDKHNSKSVKIFIGNNI